MSDITIPRPADMHLHPRDGETLKAVLPYTARQFCRAIIMPNLVPPITTPEMALAYRSRIEDAIPQGSVFEPMMTAYLTDETDPGELIESFRQGIWVAAKLYPANATTNSAFGVTDIRNLDQVFAAMQQADMPLLLHGETVTVPRNGHGKEGEDEVDPFCREHIFFTRTFEPLRDRFPKLRMVFEHITTDLVANYIAHDRSGRLAATITPHHLMISRLDLFRGGLHPHYYCLPVVKEEEYRRVLRTVATSGSKQFFAGTDSAPHEWSKKESHCCPGGVFSAMNALELYAQVFHEAGALDERFEQFMSRNGAGFYQLPVSSETVTLEKKQWQLDEPLPVDGGGTIIPFGYDPGGMEHRTLDWKMQEVA